MDLPMLTASVITTTMYSYDFDKFPKCAKYFLRAPFVIYQTIYTRVARNVMYTCMPKPSIECHYLYAFLSSAHIQITVQRMERMELNNEKFYLHKVQRNNKFPLKRSEFIKSKNTKMKKITHDTNRNQRVC